MGQICPKVLVISVQASWTLHLLNLPTVRRKTKRYKGKEQLIIPCSTPWFTKVSIKSWHNHMHSCCAVLKVSKDIKFWPTTFPVSVHWKAQKSVSLGYHDLIKLPFSLYCSPSIKFDVKLFTWPLSMISKSKGAALQMHINIHRPRNPFIEMLCTATVLNHHDLLKYFFSQVKTPAEAQTYWCLSSGLSFSLARTRWAAFEEGQSPCSSSRRGRQGGHCEAKVYSFKW